MCTLRQYSATRAPAGLAGRGQRRPNAVSPKVLGSPDSGAASGGYLAVQSEKFTLIPARWWLAGRPSYLSFCFSSSQPSATNGTGTATTSSFQLLLAYWVSGWWVFEPPLAFNADFRRQRSPSPSPFGPASAARTQLCRLAQLHRRSRSYSSSHSYSSWSYTSTSARICCTERRSPLDPRISPMPRTA